MIIDTLNFPASWWLAALSMHISEAVCSRNKKIVLFRLRCGQVPRRPQKLVRAGNMA
jgi:hypothetical protein